MSHLENITNSMKDLVGKTQQCMTDQVPLSERICGREVTLCFTRYIFFRASENANLSVSTDEQSDQTFSQRENFKKLKAFWNITIEDLGTRLFTIANLQK